MFGAIIWHSGRGKAFSIGQNILNTVVFGFIAYGRWKLAPLARGGQETAVT